ncbi:transcriptional regulator, TetR family [Chitinophaga ginsengisegetis]|uniref:Transcriptional regulator, TetR family n=1 Tax=Chitinophaga ginsengisegetis TaxID=393003 RepID=A0A1T5P9G5_9BACT|nr:TetR/AcrR family transcriptional regulator [Chitinophaga ginsengisegetis]SKD09243.1 transcriptional regulator, TetR family [Chitinophaga ginsengisegetis]
MKKEKEKIMATASALFCHSGIRSITVEDIMKNCSMSKRTFYEYFNSKDQLVEFIIEQWTAKSVRYLSLNRYVSVNAISEMSNFFRITENILRRIKPIFFHELRKYYAGSWKKLDQFRDDALIPFLVQNIDRGHKEEIYRSNIDRDLIGEIHFTCLQIILEDIWMPGVNPERVYREMNMIFLHGLVNIKGMKLMDERRDDD